MRFDIIEYIAKNVQNAHKERMLTLGYVKSRLVRAHVGFVLSLHDSVYLNTMFRMITNSRHAGRSVIYVYPFF